MTDNHERLWAHEGDVMLAGYPAPSPFSSTRTAEQRAAARRTWHGFDFAVFSDRGTKQMARIGEPGSWWRTKSTGKLAECLGLDADGKVRFRSAKGAVWSSDRADVLRYMESAEVRDGR